MNVKTYLERKRAVVAAEQTEKQKALAEKLGLYDMELAPDNQPSAAYPERIYDEQTGQVRYFRKIPAEMTREEYDEILELTENENKKWNVLEKILCRDAVCMILLINAVLLYLTGIILGFSLGYKSVAVSLFAVRRQFDILLAALYWVAGFSVGNLFLFFAMLVKKK